MLYITIIGIAFLLLLACLAGLVVDRLAGGPVARRQRTEARESRLAEEWFEVVRIMQTRPHLALIRVEENYQRAKRGTKSWVRLYNSNHSGARYDTWFIKDERPVGSLLLVTPSVGWGPHNQNPQVLYVHREQIVRRVDPRALGAAEAVERRRRAAANPDAA